MQNRCFKNQARWTWRFARSARLARILPSSRASRKMRHLPCLARKALAMLALFRRIINLEPSLQSCTLPPPPPSLTIVAPLLPYDSWRICCLLQVAWALALHHEGGIGENKVCNTFFLKEMVLEKFGKRWGQSVQTGFTPTVTRAQYFDRVTNFF